jgi:uncharacterized Zn finger protein
MDLARKRETNHPEDALPIYQRQVQLTLDQKNNEAYRAAVGLLRKVRELMARLARGADFAEFLESVRGAHEPKRNFVKLLERVKWG